jgi:hypothetical protein
MKGLQGQQIDWLMWRLTKRVARHYMHMAEMKKCRFIKVVEHICEREH